MIVFAFVVIVFILVVIVFILIMVVFVLAKSRNSVTIVYGEQLIR